MGAAQPLYRVRVNSSGLIYAVIVGAWAAYLVPMWLRRQDELNESRPTERFSTAIRLLSGKAAMERRYARENERRDGELPEEHGDLPAPDGGAPEIADGADDPADIDESVDVRAFADPKTMVGEGVTGAATEMFGAPGSADAAADGASADARSESGRASAERDGGERGEAQREKARQKSKRAKVLARRRRSTMVLFLAFTAGTIVAAVGGLAFLWAPGVPGLLLSMYIVHLRVQERRRFAAVMDKRLAKAAAKEERAKKSADEANAGAGVPTEAHPGPSHQAPAAEPAAVAHEEEPAAADRR